jgi:hypothetical protein
MALAKKLQEIGESRNKSICYYKKMYDSLSPEDQKALDEAWAKKYSANEILMALRAEGIKSSNEAIRKHRIGACGCQKKK